MITDERGCEYIPIFKTHVKIGDEIPIGFTSSKEYSMPLNETYDHIETQFLTSTERDVNFPDEENVKVISIFSVPLNMLLSFYERIIIREYEFGGTEIKCRVYNNNNDVIGIAEAEYI